MKRLILILLVIGNQGFAQVNQTLEELISIRTELRGKIRLLEDSLTKVDIEINKIIPKQEPKPIEEKPTEVSQSALFSGQKTDGDLSGEGVTGLQGNQGDPSGSTDTQNREGGTAGGGDGIRISLSGRAAHSIPRPDYPKQKSGKVVVEITVDRNGNVTAVRGGVRGSTTYDTDLVKAAEAAARKAKFDVSPNAPATQIGTITYSFKLQQ